MFYERLQALCLANKTTVTAVLKESNISTSKGTAWKNGSIPNGKIIERLANYFNVTTDYLLGLADNMKGGDADQTKKDLPLVAEGEVSNPDYTKLNPANRAAVDQLIQNLLAAQPE